MYRKRVPHLGVIRCLGVHRISKFTQGQIKVVIIFKRHPILHHLYHGRSLQLRAQPFINLNLTKPTVPTSAAWFLGCVRACPLIPRISLGRQKFTGGAPVAVMPERTPHQRPSSPSPSGNVSATAVTMPTAQKPVRFTHSSCGCRPRPRKMPDTVPYTPSGSWYTAASTLRAQQRHPTSGEPLGNDLA